MNIREATPTDAPAIRSLLERDVDADRLIRDREVIVAENESGIEGVASYETWNGAVHLSVLAGKSSTFDALLEEPRRFAANEGVPVEIVVPAADTQLEAAVERAGFEAVQPGPTFDGGRSTTYRFVE